MPPRQRLRHALRAIAPASADAAVVEAMRPAPGEPTETERLIQRSLATFARGRTTLVVAHRLSTIRHADRIAVLQDGRVAEEGAFDALVAKEGGTFAALWKLQSGEG